MRLSGCNKQKEEERMKVLFYEVLAQWLLEIAQNASKVPSFKGTFQPTMPDAVRLLK